MNRKRGAVEALRWDVYRRSEGCEANLIDRHAGPCYDAWGKLIRPEQADWSRGEMDYVRLGHHGDRHELLIDHIWVCPGHHRGAGPSAGYQWATSHRREQREWLEARYT
jgi:hypothetical protein